ncbi:MAG: putative porin [Pseudomonadota bacterium]|uniref:putative porin n=1 Tax=Aquabacterium sp. TaxID=1872578 RepID=UPI001D8131BA|nr:putative porin [Aquabacterium sp.]MBT9609303.1 putative porin [Aquabacterium sp.]
MKSILTIQWPVLSALTLAILCTTPARADERESLESLRQTTRNLIDALVESGVLSRDKADALIRSAQEKAAAQQAARPDVTAPKPSVTADGKPVLRVPYVPEGMRQQLRNEIKEEILAQARDERWGVPNAAASWTDRIKIDGDFRVRYQRDNFGGRNTSAQTYLNAESNNENGLSRAPDFASFLTRADGTDIPTSSTTEDRGRERIRMRLGLTAKVTDEVGFGLRLATGNATDRVSTNQTLGQNFNKYDLFIDRAFVRLDPADWVTVQAGRIANPWFSTEMTWSENLSFEGVATTFRYNELAQGLTPFLTMGYFPLRENGVPRRGSRHLVGAQLGSGWDLDSRTKLKFGVALYEYRNIAGRSDTDFVDGIDADGNPVPVIGRTYGQYDYGLGLRQKGNTVFETSPISGYNNITPIWGLAYKFRPLVLTASAAFSHFSPFNVMVSAEYARNMAFDPNDFRKRATDAAYDGVSPEGRNEGYQFKLAVGDFEVREAGDWQAQLTYRHVGSDAVLDAFTDSDLGLGGTNLRGYTMGVNYGLYRNTALGIRYLAAENLDTTLNSAFPNARFQVNSLQVDLNVRF